MLLIVPFIAAMLGVAAGALAVLGIDPDSLPPDRRDDVGWAKATVVVILAPFVALVVLIIRHRVGV